MIDPDHTVSRSTTALFHGLSAFPITPANTLGRVDVRALATLLARLEVAGVDSVGLLGSTGIYAYSSEKRRVTDVLEQIVPGRTKAHDMHTLLPWTWAAANPASKAEQLAA